jgi:hypothetical protein
LPAAQVAQQVNLPAHLDLTVGETGCQNSGGPQVTVEGVFKLGNVCSQVTLSNNAKGTHETAVLKEYSVSFALDKSITIPKQPVLGGVGGNPYIYLQFADASGVTLGSEIFLGRCVQGFKVSGDVINQAVLKAIVEGTDCSNHKGPTITLGGDVVLSGLNAKVIFRNNPKGTHTAESTSVVSLIAKGTTITIPKQPSSGGVGGSPLISVQFINCQTGAALGDIILLSRCNQL